jgi:peptide/nickel transport system permease protein
MFSARSDNTILDLLRHIALPALLTAMTSFAILVRVVRSAMIDVLGAVHMQSLIARGIPARLRIYRHALRAIQPITANITGLQVGWLFSGALFTEVIFSWPGIGLQLYHAIGARDVPMIMASVLVASVVFVVANLVADVITIMLDPRQRTAL